MVFLEELPTHPRTLNNDWKSRWRRIIFRFHWSKSTDGRDHFAGQAIEHFALDVNRRGELIEINEAFEDLEPAGNGRRWLASLCNRLMKHMQSELILVLADSRV